MNNLPTSFTKGLALIAALSALTLTTLITTSCSSTTTAPVTPGHASTGNEANKPKQWHCEDSGNKQWRCRDLAGTGGEPAADSRPSPSKMPLVIAVATGAAAGEVLIGTGTAPSDSIMSFPKTHYTAQLLAARHQRTIDTFIRQNPQVLPRQVNIQRDGERWLLLLLGVYPTLGDAKIAIQAVYPPLADAPWIRRLGPIQSIVIE